MRIIEKGMTASQTRRQQFEMLAKTDKREHILRCVSCKTVVAVTYKDVYDYLMKKYGPYYPCRDYTLNMTDPDYGCPTCGGIVWTRVRKWFWQT
mgnify:CR=1 FL=1